MRGLAIYLSLWLSVCLLVCLSVCRFVCLSIYRAVCLSVASVRKNCVLIAKATTSGLATGRNWQTSCLNYNCQARVEVGVGVGVWVQRVSRCAKVEDRRPQQSQQTEQTEDWVEERKVKPDQTLLAAALFAVASNLWQCQNSAPTSTSISASQLAPPAPLYRSDCNSKCNSNANADTDANGPQQRLVASPLAW